MEELVVKKDFTNIYTQKNPTPYLEEMKDQIQFLTNELEKVKQWREISVKYQKKH